jgi:apolipoprotein N-acyltransferase
VYARSIRKFTAAGAELLVNISNDSWYGRSAAREQHLLIARMRAVENGRWILRSTNDGITSAIGPSGRVEASLPSYVQDTLDVRFQYLSHRTPFVRYGEWLWWLCLLGTAAAVIWDAASPRRAALQ